MDPRLFNYSSFKGHLSCFLVWIIISTNCFYKHLGTGLCSGCTFNIFEKTPQNTVAGLYNKSALFCKKLSKATHLVLHFCPSGPASSAHPCPPECMAWAASQSSHSLGLVFCYIILYCILFLYFYSPKNHWASVLFSIYFCMRNEGRTGFYGVFAFFSKQTVSFPTFFSHSSDLSSRFATSCLPSTKDSIVENFSLRFLLNSLNYFLSIGNEMYSFTGLGHGHCQYLLPQRGAFLLPPVNPGRL